MSWYWSLLLTAIVLANSHFGHAAPKITKRFSIGDTLRRGLHIRADEPDPEDQSWVKNWAAIGDSYAAGIGAGELLGGPGDADCARYDHAFPYLMNEDERFGEDPSRQFQFSACSGATSSEILANQVPNLNQALQLITLSAGGNDVGLTEVLNACVFQFTPGSTQDCEKVLAQTLLAINNATFASNLDQLLSAMKTKLDTGGMIYYTGYAKFFGTDTADCDSVSWSFWYHPFDPQYLTQARRGKMNDLVDGVNLQILNAVNRAGNQVEFVDYGGYMARFHGRYCESGVDEQGETSANRNELLFYEWATEDIQNDGHKELKRSKGQLQNDTFAGEINYWVMQAMKNYPNLTIADGNNGLGVGNPGNGLSGRDIIPDSWKRVFHPRPDAHAIISNLIFYRMTQIRGVVLNVQVPGEVTDLASSCPLIVANNITCFPNNIPSVPSGIIASSGVNRDMTPDQLLYRMREVLCSDECQAPADVINAVVATYPSFGSTEECEISIAIEGGIEAYMYRTTAATADEQQECWDATAKIIDTCINNGPNKGWENGPDEYQFYEAGYRSLNGPGSLHTPFPSGGVSLQAASPPFTSICGAPGTGYCDQNSCNGVWYICTGGTYKGCNCAFNSKFSSAPGPTNNPMTCHTDCCIGGPIYSNDWCSANCGGISGEYC